MILAYTGYAYWVFRGKVDPRRLPLMAEPRAAARPLPARLLWFAGLWVAGVAALARDRPPDPRVCCTCRLPRRSRLCRAAHGPLPML